MGKTPNPKWLSEAESADGNVWANRYIVAALHHRSVVEELEWLIKTPNTHFHSTDYEPKCQACEWQRRFDAVFKDPQ
jgi:hypothetical protein